MCVCVCVCVCVFVYIYIYINISFVNFYYYYDRDKIVDFNPVIIYITSHLIWVGHCGNIECLFMWFLIPRKIKDNLCRREKPTRCH